MHLLPNVLELCRLGDESDVGLAEEVPVRAVTHLLQVGKVELRIFTLQTMQKARQESPRESRRKRSWLTAYSSTTPKYHIPTTVTITFDETPQW